jgi:hypothetical protein
MRTTGLRLVAFAVVGLIAGCGGALAVPYDDGGAHGETTETDIDGGTATPASSTTPPSSASETPGSSPGSTVQGSDGGPTTTPATCVQNGGSGGGGNGECTSEFDETCGGVNYRVVCACPEGTCVCFDDMQTHVIKFEGCPYCPGGPGPNSASDLYAACGFPH